MPETETAASSQPVDGAPFAAHEFHPLVEAFRALFTRRRDGGGALAVYVDGQPVVDIWAGYADVNEGTSWEHDTMSMSFSTTKGVASTLVHRLIQRGVLTVDEPVTTWWPAFGARGKADLTLADVMTHRAGLHRIRGVPDTPGDMLDHRRMADKLAAMEPASTRGKPAYHAMTYGYLIAAIVEGATGEAFPDVLAREIREPLGLDGCYISTPPSEHHRIAPFTGGISPLGINMAVVGRYVKRIDPFRPFVDALLPYGFDEFVNTPAMWHAVVPAANGVFTARSLAKMYGALANKGRVEGIEFLDPAVLDAAGRVQTKARDRVLGFRMRWRLGYHQGFIAQGEQPRMAFGHFGLGGSGGWADPETGMAIAFVTNKLGQATTPVADVRLARLGGVALECARGA